MYCLDIHVIGFSIYISDKYKIDQESDSYTEGSVPTAILPKPDYKIQLVYFIDTYLPKNASLYGLSPEWTSENKTFLISCLLREALCKILLFMDQRLGLGDDEKPAVK